MNEAPGAIPRREKAGSMRRKRRCGAEGLMEPTHRTTRT